jgi:hypothetical protein
MKDHEDYEDHVVEILPPLDEEPPVPEMPEYLHEGCIGEQRDPRMKAQYLTGAELVASLPKREWLIEDVLLRRRLYQLFGAWKAGKSLVALDAGLHAALCRSWCGKQVTQALVIYIAGEAVDDMQGRVAAWCKYHGVDAAELANFHLRTGPVSLTQLESAAALAEEVTEIVRACPDLPVMVILDTLNRNFGPGSDSKDEDMTRFVDHLLEVVAKPHDATVVVVHHSGHMAKERGRGSSVLPGVIDGEYLVEKREAALDGDDVISMCATSVMRSAHSRQPFGFKVHGVDIGMVDNFGRAVVEPVLKWEQDYRPAADVDSLGEKQRKVLDALLDLYRAEVKRMAERHVDVIAAEVTRDAWREACSGDGVIWHAWKRQYFDGVVKSLKNRGFVVSVGRNFKPAKHLLHDVL